MPRGRTKCANFNELKAEVGKLTGARRDTAEKLLVEIEFLDNTLGKLRAQIEEYGATLRTARTVKESPALKAYNTTIQRYSLLFKQVVDLLPPPAKEIPADPLAEFLT